MGSLERVPPSESSAALLPTALGENDGVLRGCQIDAAGDEASWDTSCRYRDLQRPAWPRPHSRPSVVSAQWARRPSTDPEIENVNVKEVRLDTARR